MIALLGHEKMSDVRRLRLLPHPETRHAVLVLELHLKNMSSTYFILGYPTRNSCADTCRSLCTSKLSPNGVSHDAQISDQS